MKSISTHFETWEVLAVAELQKARPFELIGFDLENPRHRTFWEQIKTSGKFHCYCEKKVKAAFVPANSD